MPNFQKFFPQGSTPRKSQIQALDRIEKIWDSGKKFAIAVLPTGSGKSHIAKAIAESSRDIDPHLKDLITGYHIYKKNKEGGYEAAQDFENAPHFGSFILTVTKALQDQYLKLFPDNFTIKGKINYPCDLDDNFTAEFAPCSLAYAQKQICFGEDRCPYYKARNSGLSSKSPFLNYSVFFNLPKFLQKRQYLILDEAAEIEEELVNKYTITLNYKSLRSEGILCPILKNDNPDSAILWLGEIQKQLLDLIDDLMAEANKQNAKSGFDMVIQKLARKISKLNTLANSIEQAMTFWKSCEYLVEQKDKEGVIFKPYDVRPLADMIFERAENVLLMSATISDPEEYAKSLGIPKKDYEAFEIDSTFESKKSPIICSKKYSLNYKNIDMILPKLVEAAIDLCGQHVNEKGIIHTHTHKITQEFIKQAGKNPRFLFRDEGSTNEMIVEAHKSSNLPTVLVSPSLDTGVSLDDDLGRFQIICKAPYLPLGSKRIKRLFEENPKKYSMKMLDSVIQMSGRCTRSIEDYSVTYILDGTLVKAIQRESKHLPHHFLERFL